MQHSIYFFSPGLIALLNGISNIKLPPIEHPTTQTLPDPYGKEIAVSFNTALFYRVVSYPTLFELLGNGHFPPFHIPVLQKVITHPQLGDTLDGKTKKAMDTALKRELLERELVIDRARKEVFGYRTLVENSPDITIRISRQLKPLFANRSFTRHSGIKVDEATILEEVFPPQYNTEIPDILKEVIATGHEKFFVFSLPADNGLAFFDARAVAEKGLSSARDSILITARDSAVTKRFQRSLLFQVRFEKLINILATNFINIDINKIDKMIKTSLKLIGTFSEAQRVEICLFSPEHSEFTCTHFWSNRDEMTIFSSDHFQQNSTDYMDKVLHNDTAFISLDSPTSQSHSPPSDSSSFLSAILVPMVCSGKVNGFISLQSDTLQKIWPDVLPVLMRITGSIFMNAIERREKEDALISKNAQLDQANERLKDLDTLKSEFVSIASHELRTPLTGIIGLTQTLLSNDIEISGEERVKFLTIIESEGKRLAALINELLDLTKMETGTTEIVPTNQDVAYILNSTLSVLKIPDNLKINTVIPKPDSTWIKADPDRIKQVLVNLIGNAIQYSDRDVFISIQTEPTDGMIRFDITNSGPQIPREDHQRVFEKFYRCKNTHPKKSKGSGLGLAIAKSIVEAHGGKIWIESLRGEGTRFCFTIPKGSRPNE